MRCDDVRDRLATLSAGGLPATVREAVRAHVDGCAACRAALARMDAVAGALLDAPPPAVPEGFASRVMAAARQRQAARFIVAWSPLRWWRATSAPMRVAAAAVLLIGLTVGLAMGWAAAPSTGSASAAASGDPVATYQVDYLGEAPGGSLADSYLTLVSASNAGGR